MIEDRAGLVTGYGSEPVGRSWIRDRGGATEKVMRFLIAGCGDTGSSLARLLVKDGHQVWGLLDNSEGATAMQNASESYTWITRPKSAPLRRAPTGIAR